MLSALCLLPSSVFPGTESGEQFAIFVSWNSYKVVEKRDQLRVFFVLCAALADFDTYFVAAMLMA